MKVVLRKLLLAAVFLVAVTSLYGPKACAQGVASTAPEAKVYLLRGLFGIFSLGMDQLAIKLREQGYEPKIYPWEQWSLIANEIVANHNAGETGQIILIGHSLGSNSTIEIANAVSAQAIPIDLIVTFDITEPLQVPANVVRFTNFFQNNGVGRRAIAGAGFAGQLSNIDLSADHSLDHLNIDESARLQQIVVNKIFEVTFQQAQEVPARRRTVTR